jgi:glucose/mannose transport system substrate-binding protein
MGSGGGGDQTGTKLVEIYSSLTIDREKMALDALVEVLRARVPDVIVVNDAISQEYRDFPTQFATGRPPDSFETTGGPTLRSWATLGMLEPLDSLATEEGWLHAIPAPVLDSVRAPNGMLYGVPLELVRTNTLFFNKRLMAANALAPPSGIADFFAVADALKSNGIHALALSVHDGWTIAAQLFEGVLVAEAGAQFYLDYLSGNKAPDSPEIVQALTDLSKMAEYAQIEPGMDWVAAIGLVCRGSAAMMFLPDVIDADAQTFGCNPDALGYVALEAPADPTFVFAVPLVFPLSQRAPHQDLGLEFLRAVGSLEGQRAFNVVGATVPARTDVDMSQFPPRTRQTMTDLAQPGEVLVPGFTTLPSLDFQNAVDSALEEFLDPSSSSYHDMNAVLAVLKQTYASIKR